MALAVAAASTMEVEQDLPGFRFHPTEEELLGFYLARVALGKKLHFDIIGTLNIYRHDPWDLPGMAKIGEREWYFFVPRDRKAGSGGRPNRTTERGFWKATGSDRAIRSTGDPSRVMGLKKTLVFYQGRAPRGTKTDWVMNEYRLPDPAAGAAPTREDTVLCKIYRKATPLRELEQRACAMEEMMMQRPDGYGGPAIVCPVPFAASTGDDYLSSSDDVQDNFLFHSFSTSSAAPSGTSMNDITATEAKKDVADVATVIMASASSVPQAANPPYSVQLPATNLPFSLQLPVANPPCSVQLPAANLTHSLQLPPANPPRSFPLPLVSPRCSLQLPTASHGASNLPSLQLPAAGHGVLEWLQDPFLTQLLSPWQDQHCLSPFARLLY